MTPYLLAAGYIGLQAARHQLIVDGPDRVPVEAGNSSNKRRGRSAMPASRPQKGGGAVQPRRRGLLGNDMNSDRGTDLSMHLNHDLVFSEFTNHALGQPHFRLVNFTTSGR